MASCNLSSEPGWYGEEQLTNSKTIRMTYTGNTTVKDCFIVWMKNRSPKYTYYQ